MTLLWNRLQLAVKEETTEGTFETLAAADGILAGKVEFDPDIKMTERPAASASLSPFCKVAGARSAKLSFEAELKGSGTPGTAPEIGKLLKTCGMKETIVASTSVTYEPASSEVKSLSLGWYVDGKRYVMAGARGSWKLDLKAGEPGIFKFEYQGTAIEEADVNLLSITYSDVLPPAFLNADFELDGYSAGIIESLSIDMGNSVNLRPSANKDHGYVSAIIAKRDTKMTVNPESVLCATKNWWTLWKAGTLVAVNAEVGATAGNICTITAPKAQFSKIKQAERNGVMVDQMECGLYRNAGDDEVVLQFT